MLKDDGDGGWLRNSIANLRPRMGNSTLAVSQPYDKKGRRECPAALWIQSVVATTTESAPAAFLLAEVGGLRAEHFGFLDQRLLLGGIFFEVRLQAQQETLVDDRFNVVGLQLERLVDGGFALVDERFLLFFASA